MPEGWQATVLGYLRKHGTRWLAARQAKVSHDTITRYEHADPAFARQVHDALQEFADSLEENAARLAQRQNNVIANIVLLKKHRPAEYIEKNLSISTSFTAELSPQAGQQLLHAMLANLTPESRRQLSEVVPALPALTPPPPDAGIISIRPADSPE